MTITKIEIFNSISQEIADDFAKRFYKEQYNEDLYQYRFMPYKWIYTDIFEICDYYFSFDDILHCEHNKWHTDTIIKYYDLCIETDWKPWINYPNFVESLK